MWAAPTNTAEMVENNVTKMLSPTALPMTRIVDAEAPAVPLWYRRGCVQLGS